MRTWVIVPVAGLALAASAWGADQPGGIKATFLVSGLHCPPCTRTVEKSLAPLPGIESFSVDWKSKSAQVQFDPSRISAARIAQRIAATPHMMGRMKYAGWLALSVPKLADEAGAAHARQALKAIKGVAQVTAYPQQHIVAVRFSGEGDVSVEELLAALAAADFEARTY